MYVLRKELTFIELLVLDEFCFDKNSFFRFETGLKLVLSKHDMERLYDFEEECVDGLLQSKEMDSLQKSEARDQCYKTFLSQLTMLSNKETI